MALRRSAFEEVGGFDESFYNGEEIELEYRLLKAGHRLAFAEGCEVVHHRRATWRGLIRQVVGRGDTRLLMFRKHPEVTEAAYLAPLPAAGLVVALALTAPWAGWARAALALLLAVYGALLLAGALHALLTRRRPAEALRVPLVLGTVHGAYAAGLTRGLCRRTRNPASDVSRPLRVLISNDGFGPNLGDRAILNVMQGDLRRQFPGVEIRGFLNSWVPSPAALARFWRDLGWADLFLMGGGQVLHDETSLCFLLQALGKLTAARLRGRAAICYGVGVGPLRSRLGRRLARRVLNRVDLILVRDADSAALLRELGVQHPPSRSLPIPPSACPTARCRRASTTCPRRAWPSARAAGSTTGTGSSPPAGVHVACPPTSRPGRRR